MSVPRRARTAVSHRERSLRSGDTLLCPRQGCRDVPSESPAHGLLGRVRELTGQNDRARVSWKGSLAGADSPRSGESTANGERVAGTRERSPGEDRTGPVSGADGDGAESTSGHQPLCVDPDQLVTDQLEYPRLPDTVECTLSSRLRRRAGGQSPGRHGPRGLPGTLVFCPRQTTVVYGAGR